MGIAPSAVRQRPLVVEVVGPWGAGKSALVASLTGRDRSVQVGPCIWTLPRRVLLVGGLQVLTTMLGLFRAAGRFRWKEGRQLIRLRALYHQLRLQRFEGDHVVVLDEGSAVVLSWLGAVAHQTASTGGSPSWWLSVLKQWAKAVDMVILLDAPDPILARRMRTRSQGHPLRDKPDTEIAQCLGRSRADYLRVLSDLRTHYGTPVLCFRTDQQSIAQITEQLLGAFARKRNGR